jgi:hypothetical protein
MEDPKKFPGMSPIEVGERILKGMKNRDLFIFNHAEMKEEVKENFEWILSYFPDEEINGSVRILKITDERPMLKIVLNMTPGERSFTGHRKVYDLIIELSAMNKLITIK